MNGSEDRGLGCFVNLCHLRGQDVLEMFVSENICSLGIYVMAFVEKE